MCLSKIIVIAALIACANSRHLLDDQSKPYLIAENSDNISMYVSEEPETFKQNIVSRVRRQANDDIYTNPDGTPYIGINTPMSGEDIKKLSVIESIGDASNRVSRDAGRALTLDNIIGHAATFSKFIPKLANQLTAAGQANLLHYDKHDITAQAFATRNFPNNPNIPNFNTFGGKLGYTYDKKIGASLGMAHTDLFKKTDYSAMSNLNLFRDHASTLNLKAGLGKSFSPYNPGSKWKPSVGLSFGKVFDIFKTMF